MENFLKMGQTAEEQEKNKKLMEAFSILDELNIDADTAEVIIQKLGLGDQMYSLLVGQERYNTAKKVWDDIFNNDTLIYNSFDDYFFAEFDS